MFPIKQVDKLYHHCMELHSPKEPRLRYIFDILGRPNLLSGTSPGKVYFTVHLAGAISTFDCLSGVTLRVLHG